ncbi:MAG: hypothetical protein QMC67_14610 [Candidatus Wallbacteria bacterium]
MEQNGLILSEPVLLENFPEGFEPQNAALKLFKSQYEKFCVADSPAPAVFEFVDFIFERLLGYKLYKTNNMPECYSCRLIEYTQELKAHRALEAGENSLLFYVVPREQNLKRNETIDGRWKASPIVKIQRLLQETGRHFGIASNGHEFIFIYRPDEGGFNSIAFNSRFMIDEPKMFNAFLGILSEKVFSGLLKLARDSYQKQIELTNTLGDQVRRGVEKFIKIMDRCDMEAGGGLLRGIGHDKIYQMSIASIMRMIFLLYAEERGLLPYGEMIYDNSYSVHTLVKDLELEKRDTPELFSHNADAWQRLVALFNLIYFGSGHEDLKSPEYSGELFEPDRYGVLYDKKFRPVNSEIYECLKLLTHTQAKIGNEYVSSAFSYKTLGVEHIGYIYEGLLDYTVKRADNSAVIKFVPAANQKTVRLDELISLKGEALINFVVENTGSKKNSEAKVKKLLDESVESLPELKNIDLPEEIKDKLAPFAALVQFNSVILPGRLYVSESADRKASGAHYTPQALTEKIVKTTLDPLVYVLEKDRDGNELPGKIAQSPKLKSPRELLTIKVCDPAMGSGAFLVQAVRYLADKLVETWQLAANGNNEQLVIPYCQKSFGAENERLLPAEYEEQLKYAKRFVAMECIHGVDINPLAVEIAKLSIWLETLSKDLPFTFIDHKLLCGDSLLGVAAADDAEKMTQTELYDLFGQFDAKKIESAIKVRHEIETMQDFSVEDRKVKVEKMRRSDEELKELKAHVTKLFRNHVETEISSKSANKNEINQKSINYDSAFHWFINFPEVFIRPEKDKAGFDAIIGNPPFLGGQKLTGFLGEPYREYLVEHITGGTRGSADFVSYFFLRAYGLLKNNGNFGLLATNTIAQGDTREASLAKIVNSAVIYAAFPDEPWEGNATVTTSRVHVCKAEKWHGKKILLGGEVDNISAFLSAEDDRKPFTLVANVNKAFQGSIILGLGFTMSEEEAARFINKDSKNKDVLYPYLNGKDLNSSPAQSPSRWVINFWDWDIERAKQYEDLFKIVEEKVKPEREKNNRKIYKENWWQYAEKRPAFYHAIGRWQFFEKHPKGYEFPEKPMERVLLKTLTSKYMSFSFYNNDIVFDQTNIVLAFNKNFYFAILQSNLHMIWAIKHGATLGLGLRYTPSDCFETFPFPDIIPAASEKVDEFMAAFGQSGYRGAANENAYNLIKKLDTLGEKYHELRKAMMLKFDMGLTDLYNAFHNSAETRDEFMNLRSLHKEIDETVLASYGWEDIKLCHDFISVPYLPANDRLRYTICEKSRIEILKRLLRLNFERHTLEAGENSSASGTHGGSGKSSKQSDKNRAGSVKKQAAKTNTDKTDDLF